MLFSTLRFWYLGWIEDHFIVPEFHFKYFGFEWVSVLPPFWMYALHVLMGLSAIGMMGNRFFRISAWVFFLTFTYTELIDLTYYLNHYYFVSLIALLLAILPGASDTKDAPSVPVWTIRLLQFQVGLVYFYAGIAKIRPEWLLDAMPLRIWLPAHAHLPIIGQLLAHKLTPWIFSWAGMLFDVAMPFLLWNRQTRFPAWLVGVVFHSLTGILFQIGVFPLVMMASAVIFFTNDTKVPEKTTVSPSFWKTSLAQAFFVIWVGFQLLFPWRYLLYDNHLFWSEEGYRFGWRVMLIEKAGTATFYVTDPESGREGAVDNSLFLNAHQEKQMAMQPDMILQFAHFLAKKFEKPGYPPPKVRAEVWVTLNGAPSKLLFDPKLNLTEISDSWAPKTWIYPWKMAPRAAL
jgi:hypothetical protein